MEQQLINELIRMIEKMGGKAVMKDLVAQVDTDGDPKHWTEEEIKKAVEYMRWQNSYFGTADVMAIIQLLIEKYNLPADIFTGKRTGSS
jgi:hypothetical protein